jgi:hypothetical protein
MSLAAKADRFYSSLRKIFFMFIFAPFCAAAVPVAFWSGTQSYSAYRGLADRGVEAAAKVEELVRTGGRGDRVMAICSFVAGNGRAYTTRLFFLPTSAYRLRTGHYLKVIYDRDNPANNAGSLATARRRIWSDAFAGVLGAAMFMLVAWIYRREYRQAWARLQPSRCQPA